MVAVVPMSESNDWSESEAAYDPRSPESEESGHIRRRSDEVRETYKTFVRARRASRTRLRVLRQNSRGDDDEELDDGSIPTFCPVRA